MDTNDLKAIDIKRDCKSTWAFSTAAQLSQTVNIRSVLLSNIPLTFPLGCLLDCLLDCLLGNARLLKQVGYTLSVLAIAALTACSSTSIPLTQKDRDSIKTIYVSKLIVRDARPALLRLDSFRGPVTKGSAYGRNRADRGDLVRYYDGNLPNPGYYEIYNNEKVYNKKLSEHFASDEKHIDQILYDSFVKEWEKRGLFPLTPSMEPDAIIKLELINYGLLLGNVNYPSAPVSLRSNDKGYAPYMMVRAYIVDANNKVIWQEEAEYELFLVGAQNRLRLQQWISRPEDLHSAFQEVSDILSEAIVAVLAKKFKNPVVSKIE